jgi:hypothetical protein
MSQDETKDAGEAGLQVQKSALRLYEVVNQDGTSVSPFVWRTKFALAKKELAYENVAVGYLDIPNIGPGTLTPVPILQSNDTFIEDSWLIAEWLDRTYPNHPAIFQSLSGHIPRSSLRSSDLLPFYHQYPAACCGDFLFAIRHRDDSVLRQVVQHGCFLTHAARVWPRRLVVGYRDPSQDSAHCVGCASLPWLAHPCLISTSRGLITRPSRAVRRSRPIGSPLALSTMTVMASPSSKRLSSPH